MRILIVEDEPEVSEVIREGILTNATEPMYVGFADTLEKGCERITEGWDLVILDLGLPDSYGKNTYEIMSKKSFPTPIIMITGWPREKIEFVFGKKSGDTEIISKGDLDFKSLWSKIQEAVSKSRSKYGAHA